MAQSKLPQRPVAPTRTAITPPAKSAVAPSVSPPRPAPAAPKPAPVVAKAAPPKPVPAPEAAAAAPVKLAEATRAVAEETIAAVAKATDAVVAAAPIKTETTRSEPTKGYFPMATSFASTSFSPAPEKMQAVFGDIQSRAKETMEKSAKLVEEMSEFAKGNVEAVMASGRVAAKGAETLGQDAAEYSKKSFEGAAAAFKGMVAAKSPTELLKLQSDYARTAFDAAVAGGSKFSEAWLKLIGEIAQPLSSRAALAAEKIKAPVA